MTKIEKLKYNTLLKVSTSFIKDRNLKKQLISLDWDDAFTSCPEHIVNQRIKVAKQININDVELEAALKEYETLFMFEGDKHAI